MLAYTTLLALISVAVGQGALNDPHYAPGHDTMVHLFEWKWTDVAEECEKFLGPMGYGGVQVSPIQENIVVQSRPWWERYQPISYHWVTRSGSKEEFMEMVKKCNKVGVRIYVDLVLNHMTANHDAAIGTDRSVADTYNFQYNAVPYNVTHFHPSCRINNYNDATNVRNCELNGLHDLDQGSEYVRSMIVDFMDEVIKMGVAGFRIDSAKHMWPKDLEAIYSRLTNLNVEHGFPANARPFIYQQVIDSGKEAVSKYDYNRMAAVTEYRHGAEISNSFRGNNLLKWFASWGESWNFLPSQDALVFIDNQDTQRSIDHQVLTHNTPKLYKMAVAFMLSQPYGMPRVMSSFHFDSYDQGPPHDGDDNILSPVIDSDNTCNYGWVCEHRWRQIYNMVRFRNTVKGTKVTSWWDNGKNQIAFGRGNAGFVAFNGENHDMKVTLKSSMPSGVYCDVISGNLENGQCTGKVVTVQQNGDVYVEILTGEEDGVLAIHKNAKLA